MGGRRRNRRRADGHGVWTGLAGFVKAMHCKELTTAIPFLSPSYPPSRSRSLLRFSLSLALQSRVAAFSLFRSLTSRLFFSLLHIVSLLSFDALPLSLSLHPCPPRFATSRLPSLYHCFSLSLSLSVSVLSLPSSSLPFYLFLSLPPSRPRRARWGALATCASLVNDRLDSNRSSTGRASCSRGE